MNDSNNEARRHITPDKHPLIIIKRNNNTEYTYTIKRPGGEILELAVIHGTNTKPTHLTIASYSRDGQMSGRAQREISLLLEEMSYLHFFLNDPEVIKFMWPGC
ncbi:hypothetical protein KDW_27920 [Dictyobacter vulcani]|uniref:Uncharacterized protein n=1 Tax=Dictyobacter vulcani TaxID=2607529 RepID=A0A5J4KQC8_9CHLR|nr:hypothetical protein [Dictyobacter vulcani]GER88630.1 hypothetical protein KDW_27920 [Dictyobacter vulcani]